ncbi:MAG: hypothetical protein JWQ81_8545 [Amycolatopsis sp.]|jgi:hypothetical protein|uniref:hypothetical protein n=1 Tax=Amycolatopsis sp. TaxID=37632 RepID=UPI002608DF8F|nr:hypothetical protein [Amycolatopsis sp.]MCU1687806.1 hypothetical protein [Amycolatopsis sp.]
MAEDVWIASKIAAARDLSGAPTQVVVGLIRMQRGDLVFSIRIGEGGEPAVLPSQSAYELIANAHLTMAEKLQLENIGGGR